LSLRIDKPIENDKDDLLNFKDFVKELSKVLYDYHKHNKDGLVISIEGEWGSGKSSIINLLVNRLENYKEKKSFCFIPYTSNNFEIIKFNPWIFSNIDSIFLSFFSEISKAIEKENPFFSIENKIGSLFKKYATTISTFIPQYLGKQTIAELIQLTNNEPSILETKTALNNELKKLDKKLVIIIDDLDRLIDKELMLILQLIKGVADFSNIIYLISYDKNVVSNSIETFKKEKGSNYLDKIVQLPISIPKISNTTIFNVLTQKIDEVLEDDLNNEIIFDEDYWYSVQPYLKKYFKNLRDVNRFLNIFYVEFPSLYKDVNTVDFISILCIKLFDVKSYEYISNNLHTFIRDYQYEVDYENTDKWRESKTELINNIIKNQITKKVIFQIFPSLNQYSYEYNNYVKKNKRKICDSDFTDTYFQLNVPSSTLSNKEYIQIESLLMNQNNSFENLGILNQNHKKIRIVLSQLSENIENNFDIYKASIQTMIINLLSYSSLNEKHHKSFSDFINFMRILQFTALELSEKIDTNNSEEFLNKILLSETIELTIKLIFIYWICMPNEKDKIQLNEEQTIMYKNKICEVVKSSNIELIINGNYGAFVFNFIIENCQEDIKVTIDAFLNLQEKNILKLLQTFKTFYTSSNEGVVYHIQKKTLYKIISEQEIQQRINKLNKLTDYDQHIIELFNKKTREEI
jgi:predicted KAP-like P-loop ATPase